MSRGIVRLLITVVAVLVVLGIVGVIAWPGLVQRSFPQTDGEVQLQGLDGLVDIYRDAYGIPHIYASTEHDLFFGQGYVHAQDRFWQMDFWRHQGAGRLSELLGEATLETDAFLRTLGWERVARQELENIDPQSLAVLEAYSEGVNAYLAEHEGVALSLEYLFLPLANSGYQPEPWEPLHTLTWAKAMAWDLRGNMDTEIDRAILLKTLTAEQVADLYPPYPDDRPVIVNDPHITTEATASVTTLSELAAALYPALQDTSESFALLDAYGSGGGAGIGSNSWALSGDLTDTGMPYLANDPHLGAAMPSIWYEIGLHCQPVGPDCQYEVVGYSFAGVPGIVIGHNNYIAWGFTNVGPDVMDLYIEKINPDNPNQYEFEGEWVDMQVLTETIEVAHGDPQELVVRLTRHGPIITDVYGLDTFAEDAGIELPENFALALSWTALESNYTFRGLWNINRAQNWEEFRQGASEFAVPAQNLLYADVEGNIGYQMPGNIPIRADGHDGMLPVPGWTGEYEWQGYIPFDELPYAFNPPEGYIVTANNAVVGPEYPYTISLLWAYGERAQRIVDMIATADRPITTEAFQTMQGDNFDFNAATLVPVLLDVSLDDAHLEEVRAILEGWDYQYDMDSAPAALFAAFWKNLLPATFDELPEGFEPGGGGAWVEVMRKLAYEPDNAWWDDQDTPEIEERDTILQKALAAAVDELEEHLGGDYTTWAWGDLHTITFVNQVMDSFPLVNTAFNEGPFRTAGGTSIVNATSWDAASSYQVLSLPSMRMIVDLSDLQNSLAVNTTGQSGHAGHPHNVDMANLWRNIQYHPMHWEQAAIEADAEGHLQLVP